MRYCRQPPCGREPHRPGRRSAMAPFPVDPSGGDGRGCARLGAGGTPALPGSHHPMTSSHQGHQIADAFWRRLSLKKVYLSSCSFVCIRGSSSLAISRFSSNDPPHRGGRGPDSRANGSFPKGVRRLSEKSPARQPPRHRRDGIAWERGRPARILSLWPPLSISAMLQAATLWAGTASARPKQCHGAVAG